MADVRPPPPIWAIAVLGFVVAFVAGVVVYFQLGTVGLDALAVATAAVVAALLVALYYRQTALVAEQTAIQRRQLELVERLADRTDGDGADSRTGRRRSVDGSTADGAGHPGPSWPGVDSGLARSDPGDAGQGSGRLHGGSGPAVGRPVLELGPYEIDGDEFVVELGNGGDAPASDLRLVVDVAVSSDGVHGGTGTVPLVRSPATTGPDGDRGRGSSEPPDVAGQPTWDGGTTVLDPGERDRFVAAVTPTLVGQDGAERTAPFDEAVALLAEAGVGQATLRVGLQHAAPGGGTTRQYLAGGALDPTVEPSLADVCHRT
jgi:hypothetical protein